MTRIGLVNETHQFDIGSRSRATYVHGGVKVEPLNVQDMGETSLR